MHIGQLVVFVALDPFGFFFGHDSKPKRQIDRDAVGFLDGIDVQTAETLTAGEVHDELDQRSAHTLASAVRPNPKAHDVQAVFLGIALDHADYSAVHDSRYL